MKQSSRDIKRDIDYRIKRLKRAGVDIPPHFPPYSAAEHAQLLKAQEELRVLQEEKIGIYNSKLRGVANG